jgi:plastocyanin
MTGRVIVQEAGASLPNDIAGYEAIAQQEMAAVLAEGKKALADATLATPMAADGTAWDVSAGAGGLSQARVSRFIPAEVRIKVGDTVRWTNRTAGEPHTVTFLGGTEQPANVLLETQTDGPPKYIQNYQTFLPMGETTFDGTGYRNSGFLGVPPEMGQLYGLLGDSYELTFTKAGWYPYYCALHASGQDDAQGMTGTVVVRE